VYPQLRTTAFTKCHLFVWVDTDSALVAILTHVGPAIAAHPLSFTFGAFVDSKASLLALVWCQAFAFRSCLNNNLRYLKKSSPGIFGKSEKGNRDMPLWQLKIMQKYAYVFLKSTVSPITASLN